MIAMFFRPFLWLSLIPVQLGLTVPNTRQLEAAAPSLYNIKVAKNEPDAPAFKGGGSSLFLFPYPPADLLAVVTVVDAWFEREYRLQLQPSDTPRSVIDMLRKVPPFSSNSQSNPL